MTARLILHIGDFKTGTTGLQHWLSAAAAQTAPGGDMLTALPGMPHAGLAHGLGDAATTARWMARIGAALAECPTPFLVVSAEHFEFADPAALRAAMTAHLPAEAVAGTELHGWVRPHLPGLMARYAESVKIGSFTGTPRGYLEMPATRRRMAYAARFGAWRAAFGPAFHLHLYDRARFPDGDIRRAFARAVTGRDPGRLPLAEANPTPGTRSLALARALHRAIGPTAPGSPAERARWTVGRHLGRLMTVLGTGGEDPPLRPDRALAERAADRFAEDAAALDATFFEGAPMREALERDRAAAPDRSPLPDPETWFTQETRAVIALWGALMADGISTPGRAQALNDIFHETSGPFPPRD